MEESTAGSKEESMGGNKEESTAGSKEESTGGNKEESTEEQQEWHYLSGKLSYCHRRLQQHLGQSTQCHLSNQ
jgi:hypothetical protein